MKVNTDGILLGAWAALNEGELVLDIGSGSGLIALMLAQRFSSAQIDAIEIDEAAASQCNVNVCASGFANIAVYKGDIKTYINTKAYDVVVSNPPYFENSLTCPNDARTMARHTDSLSYADLLDAFVRLSTPTGRCYLVLPYSSLARIEHQTNELNLTIYKRLLVKSKSTKAFNRVLLAISKESRDCTVNELVIHLDNGDYSPEYVSLTKAFYLKMPD